MKIWVDDLRAAPQDYDIHCCSVNEAIEAIEYIEAKQKYNIDLIDLDHDAGFYFPDGGDYIRILEWLEEKNISIPIAIHSGNMEGIQNMEEIISRNNWTYVQHNDDFMFVDGF